MKKEHQLICERYLIYWHQLRDTSTMSKLPLKAVDELVTVFRQHLKSKEGICTWCAESHAYLVTQVFQSYEKDAENPIIKSVLKIKIERPNETAIVPKSVPDLVQSPDAATLPVSEAQQSPDAIKVNNVVYVKEGVKGKRLTKSRTKK